jgi:hypothetical protein
MNVAWIFILQTSKGWHCRNVKIIAPSTLIVQTPYDTNFCSADENFAY